MPFPIAGVLQGVSQVANIGSTLYQNSQSKKWAQQQYQQQRADALTDWDRQNKYNSPEEQIKRLRSAGLNPNLIYGGGGSPTGNAVQVQQAQMQRPEFQAPQVDATGLLSSFYDTKLKEANLDLIKTQTEVSRETIALKAAETRAKLTDTEKKAFDLQYSKSLAPFSLQSAELEVKQKQAKLSNQLTQNEIQQATQSSTVQEAVQKVLNMRKQALLMDISHEKSQVQINQYKKAIQYIDQQIKNASTDNSLKMEELRLLKDGVTKGDPAIIRAAATHLAPALDQIKQLMNKGWQKLGWKK